MENSFDSLAVQGDNAILATTQIIDQIAIYFFTVGNSDDIDRYLENPRTEYNLMLRIFEHLIKV